MSNALQLATGGAPLEGQGGDNLFAWARRIGRKHDGTRGRHRATTLRISPRRPLAAPGNPYSPLAPLQENESYLTRSLSMIEAVIGDVTRQGFEQERIAILGFSQGGSLALEFAHGTRCDTAR